MKIAKYNYCYYYHMKTHTVHLAQQKKGDINVFVFLKKCKWK